MKEKLKNVYLPILNRNLQQADIGGSAAELSYYLLLALFPVMLLIANVVPLLPFDAQKVVDMIATLLPQEVEQLLLPTLQRHLSSANTEVISLSVVFAIWTASTGFNALQKILNRVYGVISNGNIILKRAFSFLITLLLVVVMGLISIIFVFGETILNYMQQFIVLPAIFLQAFSSLRWPSLFLVLLLAMLFIFQVVPKHNYRLKYAVPGAIVTSVGILLLSSLFSLYVRFFGRSSVASGTLGVFIVLMLYLFLSSMMLVVGALINSLYYRITNPREFIDFGTRQHTYMSAGFPFIDDKNIAYGVLRRQNSAIQFEDNPFKE